MTAKNKNETVTGPLAEGQRWSAALQSLRNHEIAIAKNEPAPTEKDLGWGWFALGVEQAMK